MSAYTDLIATAVYAPTLAGATGPFDNLPAQSFQTTGDMLVAPSASALSLDAEHAIEIWGRPDTVAAGVAAAIELGGATHGSALGRDGDRWVMTSARGAVPESVFGPVGSAVAGQWSHVLAVFRQNPLTLFIDNTATTAVPNEPWQDDGGNDGAVGGLDNANLAGTVSSNNSNPFDGLLAGVRVFDYALTLEQVATLFAADQASGSIAAHAYHYNQLASR